MKTDAVILAGAPADANMSPDGNPINRAMIEVGGKTMLQWIVDALKSSQTVGRIIVVGDVSADGVDQFVPPAGGFLENIMAGVTACGECERVLISTSDIPLITPDAVDDFVSCSIESGGDMCYPIVTKESCTAKYPQMKRTCLKTADGTFTGGNMMLMSVDFLKRNECLISRAYAARKKPLALASMIGFGLLLRVILGQLLFPGIIPISLLERNVSRMLGGKVVAVQTDYPEIGSDVDKAGDLENVRALLGS